MTGSDTSIRITAKAGSSAAPPRSCLQREHDMHATTTTSTSTAGPRRPDQTPGERRGRSAALSIFIDCTRGR